MKIEIDVEDLEVDDQELLQELQELLSRTRESKIDMTIELTASERQQLEYYSQQLNIDIDDLLESLVLNELNQKLEEALNRFKGLKISITIELNSSQRRSLEYYSRQMDAEIKIVLRELIRNELNRIFSFLE